MATQTTSSPRTLRRDTENRLLGGVCAGLGRHLGVDPLIIRILFAVAATTGFGIALYILLWAFVPADEAAGSAARRWTRRGGVEVAVGVGFLALATLLTFRALGLLFSDVIVWPLVLAAGGAALLWRQSLAPVPPPAAADAAPREREEVARRRVELFSRTGLGVALVIAAGMIFLQATGALSAARDVVLAMIAVAVALGVIFAPWIARLVRSLAHEREDRIRSQERAEMAAHLHDSVLQTLALVQKRAEDPRAVAALARTQERELRAWLAGRSAAPDHLAPALETVAGDVERAHGVPVEVVVVGDRALDVRGEALVAAAREAMVNAAKFGGGSPVDVYAEAADGAVSVYVRDRGPGFDPEAVPADRRGLRESIIGRMERHGGRVRVHSAPGRGTEIELTLPEAS